MMTSSSIVHIDVPQLFVCRGLVHSVYRAGGDGPIGNVRLFEFRGLIILRCSIPRDYNQCMKPTMIRL